MQCAMNSANEPSNHGHRIDIDMEDALRAVGFTPSVIDEGTPQGVVIFRYTRKQAIADGVLALDMRLRQREQASLEERA